MLYPDTLKDFAELFETDLIVLPSSIHEVLLLPDSGDRLYEELGLIVASINRTEVEAEERLSNQVYLYSRSMGRLQMCIRDRYMIEKTIGLVDCVMFPLFVIL